jgi:hypothetical protein
VKKQSYYNGQAANRLNYIGDDASVVVGKVSIRQIRVKTGKISNTV